jgi:hypothetical protein
VGDHPDDHDDDASDHENHVTEPVEGAHA